MEDRIKLQLDGNKLLHHLDTVVKWDKGEEIYPIYVAFSPSSMCNHKCTFCVYHYKEFKPIYFPKERYFGLVDEWKDKGVRSLFFAGDGDPLLNKDCIEMVRYTKESGIDIAMNTNARLLNEEKIKVLVDSLEWIRVSFNAGSAENYSKIHGTSEKDYDVVLNNIKTLVEQKKKRNSSIVIGIQCLLLEENWQEIEQLTKTLKKIGVDYLAIKPFLKHPLIKYSTEVKNKDEVLNQLSELESLSDENFSFVLRRNNFEKAAARSYKRCLSGPFMIEVDAYGDVYTCGPYIGDKKHCYGNVLEQSFDELWKSEQRKKVTDYLENKLCVSECMPFCRPDSVNRFLWEIKNPSDHQNFI